MDQQAAFEAEVAEGAASSASSAAVPTCSPCAADPTLKGTLCPSPSSDSTPNGGSSVSSSPTFAADEPVKTNQTRAELEHHIAVAALEPASGRALAEEEGLHGIAVGKTDPVQASSRPVETEPAEGESARINERVRRPAHADDQADGSGVEQRIREAIAEPIVPLSTSPQYSPSRSSSSSSAAAGEVFSSIEAGRQRSPGPSAGLHVADSAQLILPSAQSGGLSPGAMKTSDTHPIKCGLSPRSGGTPYDAALTSCPSPAAPPQHLDPHPAVVPRQAHSPPFPPRPDPASDARSALSALASAARPVGAGD